MDENGCLRLNDLQALVISCGTHVTMSEFSHNASKVKGFSFLVQKWNWLLQYRPLYLKMHIYEKTIVWPVITPKINNAPMMHKDGEDNENAIKNYLFLLHRKEMCLRNTWFEVVQS